VTGCMKLTVIACFVALVACRRSHTSQGTSVAPPGVMRRLDGAQRPTASGRLIHLAPAPPIRGLSLADSAFAEVGAVGRYLYHVVIRHDSSLDTLPGIVTVARPTLVADSLVLGVTYDSTTVDGYFIFRYSAPSGQLEISDPPLNLRLAVSEPAFAPNGRYIAYIAFPGDATGRAVVRRWPSEQLVVETPSDTVPATDVTGGWADWIDSTQFELFMVIADDRWVRFRGAIDRPNVVVDTVPASAQ